MYCSNKIIEYLSSQNCNYNHSLRSNWFTNPYFRGSYSHIAVNSSAEDTKILATPIPSNEVRIIPVGLHFMYIFFK